MSTYGVHCQVQGGSSNLIMLSPLLSFVGRSMLAVRRQMGFPSNVQSGHCLVLRELISNGCTGNRDTFINYSRGFCSRLVGRDAR